MQADKKLAITRRNYSFLEMETTTVNDTFLVKNALQSDISSCVHNLHL